MKLEHMSFRDKYNRASKFAKLHDVDGHTYKQIAADVGLSEGRVMQLVHNYRYWSTSERTQKRLHEEQDPDWIGHYFSARLTNRLVENDIRTLTKLKSTSRDKIDSMAHVGESGKRAIYEMMGDEFVEPVYVTKQEIADKFGIPVDRLKIKRK